MPAGRALPILRAPNAGVAQLVEQSLRKREVGGSSPSTGTKIPESPFWRTVQSLPLWARLTLAVVSASSYWWIEFPVGLLDEAGRSALHNGGWLSHMKAAIFAVLVMAPYVAASRLRSVRILAMCVASAAIYFFAVLFVARGPLSYNTIPPFVISGGGAALLVGLAVVVLAPRKASRRLFVLCLVAGAIGGAAFGNSIWPGAGLAEFGGHLAWQVLVCVALHLGLRSTSS